MQSSTCPACGRNAYLNKYGILETCEHFQAAEQNGHLSVTFSQPGVEHSLGPRATTQFSIAEAQRSFPNEGVLRGSAGSD